MALRFYRALVAASALAVLAHPGEARPAPPPAAVEEGVPVPAPPTVNTGSAPTGLPPGAANTASSLVTTGQVTGSEAVSTESAATSLLGAGPDLFSRIRDPFQRPPLSTVPKPKSELERYPLEQFTLLAVVTGPERLKALVRAPDSKTYFVQEKTRIGTRNGLIKRISPRALVVKEKILNIFGQEEEVDSELKMGDQNKDAKIN